MQAFGVLELDGEGGKAKVGEYLNWIASYVRNNFWQEIWAMSMVKTCTYTFPHFLASDPSSLSSFYAKVNKVPTSLP